MAITVRGRKRRLPTDIAAARVNPPAAKASGEGPSPKVQIPPAGTYLLEVDDNTSYTSPEPLHGTTVPAARAIRLNVSGTPTIGYVDPDTGEKYGVVWMIDGNIYRDDDEDAPYTMKAGTAFMVQLAEWPSNGAHTVGALVHFASGSTHLVTADVMVSGLADVPVISNVTASVVGTTATITATTDVAATGAVDYGTTTSYGATQTGTAGQTSHSIAISGLTQDTTYHYQFKATNAAGTSTWIDKTFFVAPAVADTTPPVISSVSATVGQSSATITWTTNETATSVVRYGTSSGALLTTVSTETLRTSHAVSLSGLSSQVTYYYRVESTDGSGNTQVDGTVRTFTTTAASAWPDATNTGVPAGTVLTNSGSITTTAAGQVIQNLNISGRVVVKHANVVIRRCKITSTKTTDWTVINDAGSSANLLVEDCEINGGGNADGDDTDAPEFCLGRSGYTARRCNLYGGKDITKASNEVLIEACYIHGNVHVAGAHKDGSQGHGGQNITYRGNRIMGPYQDSTSAIKQTSNDSAATYLRNVLIENNFLHGGSRTVYITQKTGGSAPENCIIRNNTIARHSQVPYLEGWVWYQTDGTGVTITGNVYDDGTPATNALDPA